MPSRKPLTRNQRAELFADQNGICIHCKGKIFSWEDWHVGHVIALALGGKDDVSNMGPAHDSCNLKDAREEVAPRAAKIRRQRQKHLGLKPRTSRPIPGSKASGWKKKMDGTAERR